MASRKMSEKSAIELSQTFTDSAPQKPRARQRKAHSLFTSWGGDDCVFYFRWASAAIGFHGQGIERPAETKADGRRPLALWNHHAADVERILRNLSKLDGLLAAPGLTGSSKQRLLRQRLVLNIELAKAQMAQEGGVAMPGSMGGSHSGGNPERITNDHMDAAKMYGRVNRGMAALRLTAPGKFAVLDKVFLPKPSPPEIESAFRSGGMLFGHLAMSAPRVLASYGLTTEKDRPTLETWMLRRIEKKDPMIALALEDCETAAADAVRSYEAGAEPPPAIERATKERKEAEEAAKEPPKPPRVPRRSVADDMVPEGWGR